MIKRPSSDRVSNSLDRQAPGQYHLFSQERLFVSPSQFRRGVVQIDQKKFLHRKPHGKFTTEVGRTQREEEKGIRIGVSAYRRVGVSAYRRVGVWAALNARS